MNKGRKGSGEQGKGNISGERGGPAAARRVAAAVAASSPSRVVRLSTVGMAQSRRSSSHPPRPRWPSAGGWRSAGRKAASLRGGASCASRGGPGSGLSPGSTSRRVRTCGAAPKPAPPPSGTALFEQFLGPSVRRQVAGGGVTCLESAGPAGQTPYGTGRGMSQTLSTHPEPSPESW